MGPDKGGGETLTLPANETRLRGHWGHKGSLATTKATGKRAPRPEKGAGFCVPAWGKKGKDRNSSTTGIEGKAFRRQPFRSNLR